MMIAWAIRLVTAGTWAILSIEEAPAGAQSSEEEGGDDYATGPSVPDQCHCDRGEPVSGGEEIAESLLSAGEFYGTGKSGQAAGDHHRQYGEPSHRRARVFGDAPGMSPSVRSCSPRRERSRTTYTPIAKIPTSTMPNGIDSGPTLKTGRRNWTAISFDQGYPPPARVAQRPSELPTRPAESRSS